MSQCAQRWSLDDLVPAASGPRVEVVFDEPEDIVDRLEGRWKLLAPSIGCASATVENLGDQFGDAAEVLDEAGVDVIAEMIDELEKA